MRIVLIHGRAAAMEIPELMASDWAAALRYGLRRINSATDPGSLDIRFAFYGDLWRPDVRQPLPVVEPVPEVDEGLPGFSDVSLWFDEHLGIGEALLDQFLRDVDDYFAEPALRAATNQRLVSEIQGPAADPDTIVIAFSMGTFVAYDTLRANPGLGVKALITTGSPLGMPSMYRRVAANSPMEAPAERTPFPPQLGMWVNVWTRDDVGTAGHVDLAARFPSDRPGLHVQDLETWGRSASPTSPAGAHNAFDYLSSRVLAKALETAIRMPPAGGD